MKRRYLIYNILMCLPLILTLISMFFLPDRITTTAHLSGKGMDVIGSKYELLIFPVFTLALCAFVKVILKSENAYAAGIILVVIFNLITIITLAGTFYFETDMSVFFKSGINFKPALAVVSWIFGFFIFVSGISMCFAKKPVGIYSVMKAPESDKISDIKKYNRAVGFLFMGYSLCFIASGFVGLTDQTLCTVCLTLSGMPGCIIVMIVYECVIAKKYVLR